jgi:membrane protein DedA with SNARE-associated domain
MPEEVIFYITRYGYPAIFLLIFLQETGMPNPFPNELLLMFSGYLSFKGLLYIPLVALTAISADFIGTSILYFLFYFTGSLIIKKKPRWIPLSDGFLKRVTSRISKGGKMSIYLFRLTPFTRGYASVITGLLKVKPQVFLPLALASALTWSVFYIITGYLIGPSWDHFTQNLDSFKYFMIAVLILILSLVLFNYYRSRSRNKINTGINA